VGEEDNKTGAKALKACQRTDTFVGILAKSLTARLWGSSVKNPDESMEFGFTDTPAVRLRQCGFRARVRCSGVDGARQAEGKPAVCSRQVEQSRSVARPANHEFQRHPARFVLALDALEARAEAPRRIAPNPP
jgi:hypothetical protein